MSTELDDGGAPKIAASASTESLDEDANLGRVLGGRYRVEKFIAGGGMGRVYRATQLQLDRVVAIKVLHARLVRQGDPVFTRRFTLEASTSAKLAHPNIITVHDYGEHEGQLFMATEYLDGEPLSAVVLRQGPLPAIRVLHIALQIASGLRAAHAEGVIHRDLKPENIMVLHKKDEDGRDVVKILDFGLVKIFQSSESQPGAGGQGLELTGTGSILGSPRYMAPEQINHEPVDPRTDVYALGGIMYFMLAGRSAFEGDNLIEILHDHLFTPPPPLARCPAQLAAVVYRCLEKRPDQRYASMADLIRDVKAAGKVITGETVDSGSMPAVPAWLAEEAGAPVPAAVPFVSEADAFVETIEGRPTGDVTLDRAPRRRPRGLLVGFGVAAVLLLAGLGAHVASLPSSPARPEVSPPARPDVSPPARPEVSPPSTEAQAPSAPIMQILSTPEGARVTEGGRLLGVTPLSIELDPNAREVREFLLDLPGYATSVVRQGPTSSNVLVNTALERSKLERIETEPEKPKARPQRSAGRPLNRAAKPAAEEPPPDIRLAR